LNATFEQALRTARVLIELGHTLDDVLANPLVQPFRSDLEVTLAEEDSFTLTPVRTVSRQDHPDWLRELDRSSWHYWPKLREYLLAQKSWPLDSVRSLDDASDRILRQLQAPDTDVFDNRGLVLGYVQSGKTASYTATIAKAADAGYRTFIILTGIDNGLRMQTNRRLKRELVGGQGLRGGGVKQPPMGLQWHEFTTDTQEGDFQPGNANHAALQGSQPVLLVIKKNGHVLRRLLRWLDSAPSDVLARVPVLMIDDEADQASIDTRGTPASTAADPDLRVDEPSVINRLIRELLQRFRRTAYIAYTATPFANILIPAHATHEEAGDDLYPRDFIVDLPRPRGYFGAEELFGSLDSNAPEKTNGLDVIRNIADSDVALLKTGGMPDSLRLAIEDFLLAGSAKSKRGGDTQPATMLVHTSQLVEYQSQLYDQVKAHLRSIRDEWRYQRHHGLRDRLNERWDTEYRALTQDTFPDRDEAFDAIEADIGRFIESCTVLELNSSSVDALDYDFRPDLKAIVVGGNKLSRGLTLEGLVTSYFVRASATYDTLMQMGRWFGYRKGYEDLVRIFMPYELAGWYADLAFVEQQLREDLRVYEDRGVTPLQIGMRIWEHPSMQVTNPKKRRFATSRRISTSFSAESQQTVRFPFDSPELLAEHAERNLQTTRQLVSSLGGAFDTQTICAALWRDVSADAVGEFLSNFALHQQDTSISMSLVLDYISRCRQDGELQRWSVGVRSRSTVDVQLGSVSLGVGGSEPTFHMISRSRLSAGPSIGVLTNPGDEAADLDEAQHLRAQERAKQDNISENKAARIERDRSCGLLLIYPISRFSTPTADSNKRGSRRPLYDDPINPWAKDLIGIALSFPTSHVQHNSEAYVEGSVGWRSAD